MIELDEMELDEKRKKRRKKSKGKKDRCYRIARRKYDVFPSAYASGAIVKCRQGKIWRGLKEVLSEADYKPHKMYNPETGKEKMTKTHEEHVKLAKQGYTHVDPKVLVRALEKEGGAAGLKALVKASEGEEKEVKLTLKLMKKVGKHKKGDYVLDDDREVRIVKEIKKIVIKEIANILNEKKKRKKRKKAGSESSKESSLRDWFGRKGAKGKKGGWVDCNAPTVRAVIKPVAGKKAKNVKSIQPVDPLQQLVESKERVNHGVKKQQGVKNNENH